MTIYIILGIVIFCLLGAGLCLAALLGNLNGHDDEWMHDDEQFNG